MHINTNVNRSNVMKVNWVKVIVFGVSISILLWAGIHLLDVMYDYMWNINQ